MRSESPCLCCRCKYTTSHPRQSRKTFLSPRRTTPDALSSIDHWSQERDGVGLPYEPIDPFKPSITYSLRHIFPSKTPPSLDPDPVVAALLSPCIALSSSFLSRSQSSRKSSPHASSDKSTDGHIHHSGWTDMLNNSNDVPRPVTPRTKSFADPQFRYYYSQGSAHATRRSPRARPPSPGGFRSPSARLGMFQVSRSESSHGSTQPQIAIEGPDDASHAPRTPRSASESIMSDVVRSYSQDLSSNGSPTLFSGSVRSGLPPIQEDDVTPSPSQYNAQTVTIHLQKESPRAYSICPKNASKASADHSEHSHEGVTLSIRSDKLYTAPKLHSPPKARRKLCHVGSTRELPNAMRTPHRSSRVQQRTVSQDVHDYADSSRHPLQPMRSVSMCACVFAFIIDTIPRQVYLYLMLCIPYMYFSRVANIFEEAELSLPRIKRGIIEAAYKERELGHSEIDNPTPAGAGIAAHIHRAWRFEAPSTPSIAYFNLQKSWETFVDSLMSEWQTLNIISVLLMS